MPRYVIVLDKMLGFEMILSPKAFPVSIKLIMTPSQTCILLFLLFPGKFSIGGGKKKEKKLGKVVPDNLCRGGIVWPAQVSTHFELVLGRY